MKKFLYFFISSVVVIFFSFSLYALNDVKYLCFLSELSGGNNSIKKYLLYRIYKNDEKNSVFGEISELILSEKYKFSEDVFIRILGVIGDDRSIPFLMKIYIDNQNIENKRYKIISAINSLGIIGDKKIVPFLEKLLEKDNEGYYVSRSLYFLTGVKNKYLNSSGTYQEIYITPKEKKIRKIVLESVGRERSIDEMFYLDEIFRL